MLSMVKQFLVNSTIRYKDIIIMLQVMVMMSRHGNQKERIPEDQTL